jgi:hypothetical protein
MSNEQLLSLAGAMRRFTQPVERALGDESSFAALLAEHGWAVDPASFQIGDVRDAVGVGAALDAAAAIIAEITLATDAMPATRYLELVDSLAAAIDAVRALDHAAPPVGIPDEAWGTLAAQLPPALLARYLETYQPALYGLFLATGVVSETVVEGDTRARQQTYIRREAHLERLPKIFTDPGGLMRELYRWGTADFATDRLFGVVARCLSLSGLEGAAVEEPPDVLLDRYYDAANPARAHAPWLRIPLIEGPQDEQGTRFRFLLDVLPIPLADPMGPPRGLSIGFTAEGGPQLPPVLVWPYSIELGGAIVDSREFRVEWGPEGLLPPDAGSTEPIEASAAVLGESSPGSLLAGARGTSCIELMSWRAGVHVSGAATDPEVRIELGCEPARLTLDLADADVFIRDVVAGGSPFVEVTVRAIWSSKTGLAIAGGALEVTIPVGRQFGPLNVEVLTLGVAPADSSLAVTAGITATLVLGPVRLAIDRMGVRLSAHEVAPAEPAGTLGVLDFDFGFKPPEGVGLSIDAGAVTGGGFLQFNEPQAQYVGALHLQFEEVSVNAIGILTTRLPGGQPGFSLVILVQATGFAPVQLGFGFSLTGVGGLLGVNRGVNVDVLRAGIKSRALDPILFTKDDPVPRAGAIVSALQNVFPPTPDSHVFGPMAQLEWGSPKVLTLELALLLQLPAPLRLIVLGRLRLALPEEKDAVVTLNLDALGVVDFDRREAALDASLYDSKLAEFVLTGQMAMRASWGDNPGFALALGGFHPRYAVPAGFPRLERVALTLSSEDSPRLRLESYLALTSNTVQFGARIDFYMKAGDLTVDGGLSFDTLIRLDPFELEADIVGRLALKDRTSVLMGVTIELRLSGPTPWHARGHATLEIFGWRLPVSFDAKFGEGPSQPLRTRPPVDVRPLLEAELQKRENWSAQVPSDGQLVTVREPASADGDVFVHPLAELTVSQRLVPLGVRLSKVGTRAATGTPKFAIASVRAGDTSLDVSALDDHFAPAQFLELRDDEKLAAPSYERMQSGIRCRAPSRHGKARDADIVYETVIISLDGAEPTRTPADRFPLPAQVLEPLAEVGAAAVAATRASGRETYRGDDLEIGVSEERYAVVGDDLRLVPDVDVPAASYMRADEALRSYLAEHPEKRASVRVVRSHEVAA